MRTTWLCKGANKSVASRPRKGNAEVVVKKAEEKYPVKNLGMMILTQATIGRNDFEMVPFVAYEEGLGYKCTTKPLIFLATVFPKYRHYIDSCI